MVDLVLLGPSRTERPAFRFRTRLDGAFYGFRFVFVGRANQWLMDLSDAAGASIANGIGVVEGTDMLAPLPAASRPPGQLFVVDDSGLGRVPTRLGFRQDFRMIYRPAADVAALAGTALAVF